MTAQYTETGLGRLQAAIARQTIQDAYGLSDSAYQAIMLKHERLRYASREQLGVKHDDARDGHGPSKDRSESMTETDSSDRLLTSAKELAAVFAPADEDPAYWLHRAVGNPNMTVGLWRRVLGQTPVDVEDLRRLAQLIREGWSGAAATKHLGLKPYQCDRFTALLKAGDWRKERETAFAADCIELGMTPLQSFDAWCEVVPPRLQPSLKTWRRRYRAAQRILGMEVEE